MQQFLAWWSKQLNGLVPPGLARLASPRRDAVIIEARGADFIASHRGQRLGAGRFAQDADGARALAAVIRGSRRPSRPVVLRLALPELLRKPVRLPLVAEATLAQVLTFEMDRETPFTADELYWDFTVLRLDHAAGRLDVEVAMVPRPVVDRLAAMLRAQGLPLVEIQAAGFGGRPALRLRRGWGGGDITSPGQRRVIHGLVAANAVLALLLIAAPFIDQTRALGAAKARLDAARPSFEAASALRRERDGLSEAAELLRSERARSPGALRLLQAITNALPDDSWLTEVALRGEQLTITGRSPSAAGILGRLAAAPLLRDPAFTAPITRREGTGAAEHFTILVSTGSVSTGPAP